MPSRLIKNKLDKFILRYNSVENVFCNYCCAISQPYWPNINWWARYSMADYPCAKFVDVGLSSFGFIART